MEISCIYITGMHCNFRPGLENPVRDSSKNGRKEERREASTIMIGSLRAIVETTIRYIVTAVFIVVCAALIILVLKQEAKNSGLGTVGITYNKATSYWDRHKARSVEGRRVIWTRLLTILFAAGAIVLNIKL